MFRMSAFCFYTRGSTGWTYPACNWCGSQAVAHPSAHVYVKVKSGHADFF